MYHLPENHFQYIRNNSPLPTLYVDLDGVICDFFRYFCHVFRMKLNARGFYAEDFTAYGYAEDKRIRTFMNKTLSGLPVDYWANMPFTQLGKHMWNSLNCYKPYVFYNVFENDPSMEIGRFKQVRRQLRFRHYKKSMSKEISPLYSDLNRILINKDKSSYARNPNGVRNVLIDDNVLACDAWEEAGGKAFLFIDNLMVIERLINEVKNYMETSTNLDFLLEWHQGIRKYIH